MFKISNPFKKGRNKKRPVKVVIEKPGLGELAWQSINRENEKTTQSEGN